MTSLSNAADRSHFRRGHRLDRSHSSPESLRFIGQCQWRVIPGSSGGLLHCILWIGWQWWIFNNSVASVVSETPMFQESFASVPSHEMAAWLIDMRVDENYQVTASSRNCSDFLSSITHFHRCSEWDTLWFFSNRPDRLPAVVFISITFHSTYFRYYSSIIILSSRNLHQATIVGTMAFVVSENWNESLSGGCCLSS
jgi:hypothetical protein